MADRLRDEQCLGNIRFAIGVASKGIGSKYGKGYRLRVMAEWLSKVALSEGTDFQRHYLAAYTWTTGGSD